MRRILIHALAASLSLAAIAQDAHDGRFQFMAWDYVDQPRILESMHHAGITSVAFVPAKMLDTYGRLQLNCIIFDEGLSGDLWSKPFDGDRFRRNFSAVVKEAGSHAVAYGYHVKDEPPESDFPELAKAVAAVKELAPGK